MEVRVAVMPLLALVTLVATTIVIAVLVLRRRRAEAPPANAPRGRRSPALVIFAGFVMLVLAAVFGLYHVRSAQHFDRAREEGMRTAVVDRRVAHEGDEIARHRNDAPAGEVEYVPPPPAAPSSEPVFLSLGTRDDRADWVRAGEIQENPPQRPSWVESNAGAERWVEADGGIAVESYRPGDSGRLAGYSRYCASPPEARDEALDAASEKLTALVLWRLRDDGRGKSATWYDDVVPIARNVVDRRVVSAALDEYAESVERSYGTVHRHAVLVDASPRVIAEASDELQARLTEGAVERLRFRRRLVSTLASAFGVALVVILVYSFLNAGTKGHFAWPLRILSVLALGLLFLGILYWKEWLAV